MLQQEVTDYEVAIQRLHTEVARMQKEWDRLEAERVKIEHEIADKEDAHSIETEVTRP